MKIEIRLEIDISIFTCVAVKKMEVIGCLVPELRSEKKHHGCRTQLFEKNAMFLRCYVSPYIIVLRKIDKVAPI